MKRRSFLISAGVLLAAGVTTGAGWLIDRLRAVPTDEPKSGPAGEPSPVITFGETPPIIPPETAATLLAIADVIVPRHGDSPSAAELDLLPRLERLINDSPARAATYRSHWPKLATTIQQYVPVVGGRPDPDELARRLQRIHRRFRRAPSGGGAHAKAFEQLRRDVMRLYYTSPVGRAWVGYHGRQLNDPRDLS